MRSPVELGDDRWISVESTLGHNLDLIVHEAVTNEDMGASCMLHLHATRPGDERFLRSVQWAMGNVNGQMCVEATESVWRALGRDINSPHG